MNYRQKKDALKIHKKYVSELLHAHHNNALHDLNYRCLCEYQEVCDMNLRALQAGAKINKVLSAYIREKYQITADAYIYNIDPLTGCRV